MHLKLIGSLSIPLLLVGCATGNTHKSPQLRYDGVYKSKMLIDDEKYCRYLRHYPTGEVITVTSVCSKSALKDIKKWFDMDHAGPEFTGVSKGTALLNANQIRFDGISKEGKVSYEGTFSNKKMHLSFYSHITKLRGEENYKFVEW